jgi:hypothetical protein
VKVEDILKKYLSENGYDGFYNSDMECGCTLEDFMPCGQIDSECSASYLHESPETCPPDCEQRCFDNKDYDYYFCDKRGG